MSKPNKTLIAALLSLLALAGCGSDIENNSGDSGIHVGGGHSAPVAAPQTDAHPQTSPAATPATRPAQRTPVKY